jgi:hypothetical protein
MPEELQEESRAYRVAKNRFVALLCIAIAISLFLVGVALALYSYSGTAQLDLSRPGYSDVRDQVIKTEDQAVFPSTGSFNKEAVDKFEALYDATTKQTQAVNAFEPGALSDEALRINDEPAPTANQ